VWAPARSTWSCGTWDCFVSSWSGAAKGLTVGAIPQYDLVNKLGDHPAVFVLRLSDYPGDGWGEIRWFLKVFVCRSRCKTPSAVLPFFGAIHRSHGRWPMCCSGQRRSLAAMLVDRMPMGDCWPLPSRLFFWRRPGASVDGGLAARACLLSLSIGLFLTSSRSAWLGCALLSMFGIVRNPRLLLGCPIMVPWASGRCPSAWRGWLREHGDGSSRQNTIDERVEINEKRLQNVCRASHLRRRIAPTPKSTHHRAQLRHWFLAEFGLVGFVIFTALFRGSVKINACWLSPRGGSGARAVGPDRGHLA